MVERREDMYTTAERRAKPRIDCDYQALIQGNISNGKGYQDTGRLVNMSASGLYLLINQQICQGSKLAVIIFLSEPTKDTEVPMLVANGIVVRSEPKPDGLCGIAVKFHHYRFQ